MLLMLLILLSIVLEAILQLVVYVILLIIGFFALWGISDLTARTCRSVYDYIKRKCS
jgi:hypothetical protein